MNDLMIPFAVLLIFIFLGRMIQERANKHLETDLKAGLIDLFTWERNASFVLTIVAALLFFASIRNDWVSPQLSFAFYAGFIVLFLVLYSLHVHRKLNNYGYPEAYIRSFVLANALRLLGILIFFGLIV